MSQELFNLNRYCFNSLIRRSPYAVLALLAMSTVCAAQEVKEYPLNSGLAGKQPEVYWHGTDLSLDIDASTKDWNVVVTHRDRNIDHISLPREIDQVDVVRGAPQNRAIVIAEIGSGAYEVVVMQTDPAKLLDKFLASKAVSLSPDNRYVLFVRFYPMHGGEGYDDQYRLYDVQGNRSTNWPNRPAQDVRPNMPANYDETLAGVPVYPVKVGELGRMNTFVPEGHEHLEASDFNWTTDSSKVAFADVQGNVISLVVVTVPTAEKRKPQTAIYPLVGLENVCGNPDEGEGCNNQNVRSIAWDDDSIGVALLLRPQRGKDIEKNVTIPLSSFVPAGE